MTILDGPTLDSRVFAWAILVLAEATLVVVVAGALAATLHKRHAAARHRTWVGALFTLVAIPIVVPPAGLVGWKVTVPAALLRERADEKAPASAASQPESFAPTITSGTKIPAERAESIALPEGPRSTIQAAPPTIVSRPIATPPRDLPRLVFRLVAVLYGLGVLVGIGRLAAAFRNVRVLRTSLVPIDIKEHAQVLIETREALDLRDLPPIAVSRRVSVPAAIGVRRPVVVLPEGLVGGHSRDELRDVLIHECAHVVHRDVMIGVTQRLVAVVYWPHPLVHWMNALLGRAREEVCDNHVLHAGDPCRFAKTLVAISENARPTPAFGVGLFESGWTLQSRIQGILDPRRNIMTRPDRRTSALVPALMVACLATAMFRPATAFNARSAPSRDDQAAPATPARFVARGSVVDASGSPVAGALVALSWWEKEGPLAVSGADGSFSLPYDVPLPHAALTARTPDESLIGLGLHEEPANTRPAEPTRIVVRPSRSVVVHLRDVEGKAIPDADVEVLGDNFRTDGKTDPQGDATLRVPVDGRANTVLALKAGVGFDYFENYRARAQIDIPPLPPEITLVLDGARTFQFKAVDSAGRPFPGVVFRPMGVKKPNRVDSANTLGSRIARVRTDDQGIASVSWLPKALSADGQEYMVEPWAYACPVRPADRAKDVGRVREYRVLRNGSIRGVVRDMAGRPAAGVLLQAEGRGATSDYCRQHTRSGPDGTYGFDVLAEESYMVATRDEERVARTRTGIDVGEGQVVEGIDLTLGAGTVLRGRVTIGPDRVPAPDERITVIERGADLQQALGQGRPVYAEEEGLVRWVKTDAHGEYRLRLGPGRYRVTGPDHGLGDSLTIGDEAEVVRDFEAAGKTRRRQVAVEVVAKGGGPVAGATVRAAMVGKTGYHNNGIADDRGRVEFYVPPGEDLVFLAQDPGGRLAGFTVIKADAESVLVELRPARVVEGRVVDGEGRPKVGQQIQVLWTSTVDKLRTGDFAFQLFTDENGRYELKGLPTEGRVDTHEVRHIDGP